MATQPGGEYIYDGGGQSNVLPIVVASNEQGELLNQFFSSTLAGSAATQSTNQNGTTLLKGSNGKTVKIFTDQNKGKVAKGTLTKNESGIVTDNNKSSKIVAGKGANEVLVQGKAYTYLKMGGGNDKVVLATDGNGSAKIELGSGRDTVVVSSEFGGNAVIRDFTKKDQLQIIDRAGDSKVKSGEDYTYFKSGKDTVLVLFDKAGKETTKITLKNVKTDKVNIDEDGILTIS